MVFGPSLEHQPNPQQEQKNFSHQLARENAKNCHPIFLRNGVSFGAEKSMKGETEGQAKNNDQIKRSKNQNGAKDEAKPLQPAWQGTGSFFHARGVICLASPSM